ncbi:hypothetical protein D3C71_1739320 [compost metagenome]
MAFDRIIFEGEYGWVDGHFVPIKSGVAIYNSKNIPLNRDIFRNIANIFDIIDYPFAPLPRFAKAFRGIYVTFNTHRTG